MKLLFNFNKLLQKFSKKLNNRWIIISLLILTTIISTIFLMDKGILKGHDIEYHLSRIKGISECLQNGDIKALIHNGFNEYGYPNGLFYSNLFLYFPALLCLFGLNIITSYKIFLFVCTFFTSLTMYYCIKKITNDNGKALLVSFIYTTSSYRICDVFVRAAVGEVLSFIFIPLAILGLYEIIKGNYKKYFLFSIGFIGLINSHLISTIIMLIISTLIIIFNYKPILENKNRIKALIFSVLFGLGVGAFFIFPFIEQYFSQDLLINTRTNSIDITMPITRIFFGIPNYTTRFLPSGIGLIYFWAIYLRIRVKTKNSTIKFADQCMVIGFISLFLSTDFVPWKELSPLFGFIQFSWRLLLVATTFLSIFAGIIISEYINKKDLAFLSKFLIVIYITILCIINQLLSYLSIETYYNGNIEKIYDYTDFSIAAGEYLPAKTDWSLIDADKKECRTNSGDIKIVYKEENGKRYISYKNNLSNNTYIDVPILYYKGYNVTSSHSIKYDLDVGYNTWLRIYIGNNEADDIVIYYDGTPILKISYMISLITISYFIITRLKNEKNES